MNLFEFMVSQEDEGIRLDMYLANCLGDMSRSFIQKLIKDENTRVNDKNEKCSYLVKEEDKIRISVPEPKLLQIEPQNIDIDIVYEDEDVLVVNKPQGMVVHPAPGNYEGTLVNAILYHCKDKLSSINGIIRPGIVHRIDKNTSGLLMIAKNDHAHSFLSDQLKAHSINRKYEMICQGVVKEDVFTVDAPIARNPNDRLKMAIRNGGKDAVTHFNTLKRFEKNTYLEAKLETGRTHQIRVHIASKHHPLVGDEVYGYNNSKYNLKGQVLHAKALGFIHPTSKEYMEFNSDVPAYFEKLLKILE